MRWKGSRRAISVGIFALTLSAAVASGAGTKTRLASQTSTGDPAATGSDYTAISGSGKQAAFNSTSANLPGANGKAQVYVYDLRTHKLKLASQDELGDPGDQSSGDPWLSGSGRFLAFASAASNLPGGDGASGQAYVRDLKKGLTTLASASPDGDPVEGSASDPSISDDGRIVGFAATAGPNMPGAGSIGSGAYVYDRRAQTTVLASRTDDEKPVNTDGAPVVSGDGKHVTFIGNDPDLPDGDGTTERVYVRNLANGTTRLVSQTSQEDPNDGDCGYAAPSADAAVVTFTCTAMNMPGGDGMTSQVYVRDMKAGTTRLVSATGNGTPAGEETYDPSISGNGKAISFYTSSNNLPGGDNTEDVYVYAVGTGKLAVASRNSAGDFAEDDSEAYPPALSRTGAFVVFRTNADNLPGTDGLYAQLFVRGPTD
jgi:TolB protein